MFTIFFTNLSPFFSLKKKIPITFFFSLLIVDYFNKLWYWVSEIFIRFRMQVVLLFQVSSWSCAYGRLLRWGPCPREKSSKGRRNWKFSLTCPRLGKFHSLRLRLVAVKRFLENTYFPKMLIFEKGKCFPLFGCLGNRFLENQFRCLVHPNILRKWFYGKSIPVFDSSKHFMENALRKSFYGKSFPVFGLWIIFTENMKCVTNSSTCIIYTTL